ncbi:MAG: hypothetical protein QG574_5196 [Cyanobacteriota bacterium erpe_2018_sw_21hr_WHONDRS-SW48-000092_B_bin.40]|nr:hypothetical protein [Cyanobacteriota bacterium erpe_2018_sw_21hr_WHONDRS-SW48-000092_B_bin.40]
MGWAWRAAFIVLREAFISGGIFYFWRNLLFLAEPGSPAGVGGENEAASAKGPRAGHHKRSNPENFFGDEQSARPVIILHSGHRHFVLRLLHVEGKLPVEEGYENSCRTKPVGRFAAT